VLIVPRPLRIGLTGGIASGKSTVADLFAELGAAVIDTDIIAREVVQPGQPALDEIRAAFGANVFSADGTLDRNAMRRHVFSDDSARHRLEAILHPRIQRETIRQMAEAGGDFLLVVVPLYWIPSMSSPAFRAAASRRWPTVCTATSSSMTTSSGS
jgi:dephospho-CoA kinase